MVKISERAKEKMMSVLADEGSTFLRFGLQGGGCNGFTYYFAIEESPTDDDILIPITESYNLLVDAISNMYLDAAEIDYKEDLMGEAFVFNNPSQTSSCGCGNSVGF